jgi:effector-binding domain-containing protein
MRTCVEELPEVLGQWYDAIAGYRVEPGEEPAGAPFAAYYNLDMQDLEVGIGFPVARSLSGKAQIQPGEISGGSYATCLYTGPYSELGTAYDPLNQWMADNGYTPSGLVYEIYLNDSAQTPPQELKTLIPYPLTAES